MKDTVETKMVAGSKSVAKLVKMKVLRAFALKGLDGAEYAGSPGSADKPQFAEVPEDVAVELERKFSGSYTHLGTVSDGSVQRHQIVRAVRV